MILDPIWMILPLSLGVVSPVTSVVGQKDQQRNMVDHNDWMVRSPSREVGMKGHSGVGGTLFRLGSNSSPSFALFPLPLCQTSITFMLCSQSPLAAHVGIDMSRVHLFLI